MLKIKQSSFVKSVVRISERPQPPLPEFAFAGRSNVGKSSLINCLVNRKNFAKVSKHPGKTRTINYFIINKQFYLVDLPGYGFARVSKTEKLKWKSMIEEYLLESDRLQMLYLLIDAAVGPQTNDLQLIEWVQYHQLPFFIIATKADKIKGNARAKLKLQLAEILEKDIDDSFLFFSSKNRLGRAELLSHIGQQLARSS